MTKKLLMLTGVVVTIACLAGCSTCGSRNSCSSWFNRGDRCNTCPPPACGPQATMMLPTTPQVMPGPIEIAPTL
jgi:hypothetical protein